MRPLLVEQTQHHASPRSSALSRRVYLAIL